MDLTGLNSGAKEYKPFPDDKVKALNRIAAALERLADVYLYVNDPEPEEQGIATTSLSQVPKL